MANSKVLLDDLPTLDDKLNWEGELGRMKFRVENCPTPHVIGIHGNWGSGKTSFMRQLQHRLGGEADENGSVRRSELHEECKPNDNVVTIWFDAWRYQNESSPIVALLQEMRRQFSIMRQVVEKFKKFSDVALRYTLDGLSDISKIIGIEAVPNSEKLQKYGESWETLNYQSTIQSDSIRTHLHNTIVALLPCGENTRVIVFVDDLDRCNPKAAFKLLEGLKIYLNLPNCVFVLGMNENILIDAIREEISAPAQASPGEMYLRASHYLEKICTDIYRLPLPSIGSAFFSRLLSISEPADSVNAFKMAIGTTICLPPNPRRLKALANQWRRFAGCVPFPEDEDQQKVWAVRVLVASYIHQFHRDLWERWHFDIDFWGECIAWCNGERNSLGEGSDIEPKWASALKLTTRTQVGDDKAIPAWAVQYPNPGDIDLFWIDGLIREYKDHLLPLDFKPLLEGRQHELRGDS